MNRIFTVFTAVLLSVSLWAQAPQQFSYQAVIRNSSNSLVTSTKIGMKISLLQGSSTGNAVYVETHAPTTNANGLVSLAIGGGTKDPSSAAFTSVDWANGTYFVKTETDPAGGTTYSLTTTSQLLSVPYALHAKTAESIVGGNSGGGSGSFSHYIGEAFGGGVIFHLWKDAQGVEHGLVVAKTDQSTSQAWSNISNVEIGQTAQSSWDGLSNSNAIVSQSGHTSSAAKLCLDLVSGGQSDWYLPSTLELNMLWINYFTVVKSLSQTSGASQLASVSNYWSSSEGNSTYAWYVSFDGGSSNDDHLKDRTFYVRAVRAF
jgi:hypothetical protein